MQGSKKPGIKSNLNNDEQYEYDGRKKCPHCRRKFNVEPFKRHVDICPSNKNRKILKL